ncbi:hypothetical protein CSUB01_08514 [Colletotrichum sublineola]|uniref:PRA1 family protein n=1 Tax=Colletotrichum sublineola TaxID=1173701 RepID=A0A066X0R5_COLSU|nr:hypothetical protein CSUB01_08514 [Colletotrichum sublineola]
MLSFENLQVIISMFRTDYWPYVARALESSTSSPLFDFINPDYLTLPTSFDDLQNRIRKNFIRFHVAYIVIITFGLLARHWHVAAVVAIVHKLGTLVTSPGRGDASMQSDTGQDEITRYAHSLMRGIWLSSGVWCFWSLYSILTTALQFTMVFMIHAAILNSKARVMERRS